jgi:hypothetical protein
MPLVIGVIPFVYLGLKRKTQEPSETDEKVV